MTQEFEATSERTVKIELHFHLSVAGDPYPNLRDWPGAPHPTPRAEEPAKPRGFLRKSLTFASMMIVGAFGVSLAHRVLDNFANRSEIAALAAAPAPAALQMAAPADLPNVVASSPEANAAASGEAPRRGTGAFGLH